MVLHWLPYISTHPIQQKRDLQAYQVFSALILRTVPGQVVFFMPVSGKMTTSGTWEQLQGLYVNLGFYGSGNLGLTDIESVNLNLDAWLLVQRIKFRLGETNLFLGGQYLLFDTYNTFDIPIDIPDFTGMNSAQRLARCH